MKQKQLEKKRKKKRAASSGSLGQGVNQHVEHVSFQFHIITLISLNILPTKIRSAKRNIIRHFIYSLIKSWSFFILVFVLFFLICTSTCCIAIIPTDDDRLVMTTIVEWAYMCSRRAAETELPFGNKSFFFSFSFLFLFYYKHLRESTCVWVCLCTDRVCVCARTPRRTRRRIKKRNWASWPSGDSRQMTFRSRSRCGTVHGKNTMGVFSPLTALPMRNMIHQQVAL